MSFIPTLNGDSILDVGAEEVERRRLRTLAILMALGTRDPREPRIARLAGPSAKAICGEDLVRLVWALTGSRL
jgi:hypothetical protein